jgi:hypothetical protein
MRVTLQLGSTVGTNRVRSLTAENASPDLVRRPRVSLLLGMIDPVRDSIKNLSSQSHLPSGYPEWMPSLLQ